MLTKRICDIKRYGQINLFDFYDRAQDSDAESDLKKFLDIAKNNVVPFENDSIFDVVDDVIRDKHPFTLKGEIKMNDNDPTLVNNFFKNVNALNKWIEKVNDKYDEILNITFTGELFKYTKTFNKIQRSNYGTGCDSLKKIVESRGNLCYIPAENECFRRSLKLIYKKDFSQENHEFIRESQRNKNIMTSAKRKPFCKKHNINLGVYDPKQKKNSTSFYKRSKKLFIYPSKSFFV